MSERTKKILFIVGFIILVILLGYLLYYLLLRPSITPAPPTNVNGGFPGGLPGANVNVNRPGGENVNGGLTPSANLPTNEVSPVARGGVTQAKTLVSTPTIGATLSGDGKNLFYYNKADGKFYKVDSSGAITLLTDKVFHNVDKVYWSPQKDKAVLEYPDGSNISYNFAASKQVTLPKQWQDFSFSPTNDRLTFENMTIDEESRYLAVASDDGSNYRRLETLGDFGKDVTVDWSPNQQVIATYVKPLDFDRQYLYFVGLNKEDYNATIIEGRDYRSQWSPDGERLLYSVYSVNTNLNPTLWVVDAKGENIGRDRTPLQVQTWADKCTFADALNIYCAVPSYLEKGSGLVPDYAANVPDDFYKINIASGAKTLLAIPNIGYNAVQLSLSADGQYLYFVDKNTGQINQLKLK